MSDTVVNVLSIDAWRYDGCWNWNAWYTVGTVPLATCDLTPRRLLAYLRKEGYLAEGSKGRVRVEDDGYNVVVLARGTGEPLIALEYGPAVDL